MTLLDLLIKAAGPALGLAELLKRIATNYPDLKPEIDNVLLKLQTAVDPVNLAAVGAAIPGELLNLASGKVDPRIHPSDLG